MSMQSMEGQVDRNLEVIRFHLKHLKEEGVAFVLLPELCLSGYTKNRQWIDQMLLQKDDVFQQLCELSTDLKLAFAIGFPELEAGQLYITHYLFSEGNIIGKHRKTHLSASEKTIYSEGDAIDVFNVNGMMVGIQLCYETHFPEISFVQAQKGAQLLACAFASPMQEGAKKLERFKRFLPARAYDNTCYLMACNTVNEGSDYSVCSLCCDPKGVVFSDDEGSSVYVQMTIDQKKIDNIKESRMGWFNANKRMSLFTSYYNSKHE